MHIHTKKTRVHIYIYIDNSLGSIAAQSQPTGCLMKKREIYYHPRDDRYVVCMGSFKWAWLSWDLQKTRVGTKDPVDFNQLNQLHL